jgi:hypothetical protein
VSVFDISKVQATSIFRVKVKRMNECSYIDRFWPTPWYLKGPFLETFPSTMSLLARRGHQPLTLLSCASWTEPVYTWTLSYTTYFDTEDGEILYVRDVGNVAHFHTVLRPNSRIIISNELLPNPKVRNANVVVAHLIILHFISLLIFHEKTNKEFILWFSGIWH